MKRILYLTLTIMLCLTFFTAVKNDRQSMIDKVR